MIRIPELRRISRWVSGKGKQTRDEQVELLNIIDTEVEEQQQKRKDAFKARPMTTT